MMPRAGVPFALDRLQVASSGRRPGYIVRVYDVRSTIDTIGTIVREIPLQVLTGPRDFSAEATEVDLTEVAGDFINLGVQSALMEFTIVDKYDRFNPVKLLGDPTGDGRWLRAGNVVRLLVGDDSVDTADWPVIFTGTLLGVPGISNARSSGRRQIKLSAAGREAAFVNLETTTPDFGINTTHLTMAQDVAEIVMGLDADEIDFFAFGANTTAHISTQLALQSPMAHLAQILMIDGFMPIFDGEGKLTQTLANIAGLPDRTYDNLDTVIDLGYPSSNEAVTEFVQVEGLDSTMHEMKQPIQDLAEVQITTGYFAQNEEFDVFFSDDRTAIAEDLQFKVLRSVNGALNFGGSESFSAIPAPDGLGGFLGVEITVSTGFAGALLINIVVGYVAAAWVPDTVLAAFVGETLPVGRAFQAIILVAILLIMTQIGRLHVLIRGAPTENVFPVITGEALLTPAISEQPQPVVVVNHLINTQALADTLAQEFLFRQIVRSLPRNLTMLDDIVVIPNDIMELPDAELGPRRFLANTIARRYRRGELPQMVVSGFETTAGLLP